MANYRHPHHNQILRVLSSLKNILFSGDEILFGGGTLIALTHNEFRRSDDIDFVATPRSQTYKDLRRLVREDPSPLFENLPSDFELTDATCDQYGIRFAILYEEGGQDKSIKFEIFQDARLDLDPGVEFDGIPVKCLSTKGQIVQKLFAITDRGMGRGINHRDIYDLSVLVSSGEGLEDAIDHANQAYDVERGLNSVLDAIEDPEVRDADMDELDIAHEFRPEIVDGLVKIREILGLDPELERHHFETHRHYPS